MDDINVLSIELPEYRIDSSPDLENIGQKLSTFIQEHFSGQQIAIRCLGLADHPSMTMDQLVETIKKLGTDRYDPERKLVCHDFYVAQGVDPTDSIFASEYNPASGAELMREIIDDFYEGALADRGFRIRIDLILIYDLSHLRIFPIDYGNGDIGNECFVFNDPEQKREALLGIIKVL